MLTQPVLDAILAADCRLERRPGEIPAGPAGRDLAVSQQFQRLSNSARSKHFIAAVIDPPVTEEERLADALAAFGVLCDRAIEYLDLFTWGDGESSSVNESTPA